jgi:hypothetical protein
VSVKQLDSRESIEKSGVSADSLFVSSSGSSYIVNTTHALVLMRPLGGNATHCQGHSPAC